MTAIHTHRIEPVLGEWQLHETFDLTHPALILLREESQSVTTSIRVVSEARRAMGLHEYGVFARFRYNDLKEAARGCGGRGPYGNSMMGRSGVQLGRGCAAKRDT
jgi:hypothetical protein